MRPIRAGGRRCLQRGPVILLSWQLGANLPQTSGFLWTIKMSLCLSKTLISPETTVTNSAFLQLPPSMHEGFCTGLLSLSTTEEEFLPLFPSVQSREEEESHCWLVGKQARVSARPTRGHRESCFRKGGTAP